MTSCDGYWGERNTREKSGDDDYDKEEEEDEQEKEEGEEEGAREKKEEQAVSRRRERERKRGLRSIESSLYINLKRGFPMPLPMQERIYPTFQPPTLFTHLYHFLFFSLLTSHLFFGCSPHLTSHHPSQSAPPPPTQQWFS